MHGGELLTYIKIVHWLLGQGGT